MNEIIDWESKGNVIRFYLGKNGEQWGDDWNDAPYEHNAGIVYDEFRKGKIDIAFPFIQQVIEPNYMHNNSPYSKEDMINRKVPCVVVSSGVVYYSTFEEALADSATIKYYFGDKL